MPLVETQKTVPARIRAGDSVSWELAIGELDPAEVDVVWHFFREGSDGVKVDAGASGQLFTGALKPGESRRLDPGFWRWVARATEKSSGDVRTVLEGVTNVTPDALTRYDLSHAEEMLEAVRAVQKKRQGKAYNSGAIAGTDFDYKSDEELRDAEQHFMGRVNHLKRIRDARDSGTHPMAGRRHFRPTA